jgi:hypothetical protein
MVEYFPLGFNPQGKSVSVRYSPDNPAVSVLEPGFRFELAYFSAFGFVCLAAAILMAIFLPKAAERQRQATRDL